MQQLQRVQLDFQARLEHAYHGSGATTREHGKCLFGSLLEADAFEGVVHTASGQLHHLFGGIAILAIDQVGGAELPGQFQFGIEHVDGDDPPCPGQCGTIDGRQSDTAAADHRHGFARAHLCGVEYRASTGRHGTTEQRSTVQRHVATNRNAGVFVHQHLFGKARQVDELRDRLLHVGQARFLVLATLGFRRHAARQVAGHTVIAVAAEHRQASDHMIAGLD